MCGCLLSTHQLRRPCLPRGRRVGSPEPRARLQGVSGGGSHPVRATHWAFSGFRQKIAGDAREGKGPSFVAKRHCGPRGKRMGATRNLSIIKHVRSRTGRYTLTITPPTHPKPPLHHPPPRITIVGLSNILNSELNRRKPVEGPHGQVVGTAVVKGKLL